MGSWNAYASGPLVNVMLAQGATVHASAGGPGVPALCGVDGEPGSLALDLTSASCTPEYRAMVNCQGCLEWMHA